MSSALVGHIDTWTAWVNSSNAAVISACDFIGMDAYPYFQNTEANSINDAYRVFFEAYNTTNAAAMGKPVWITETGWPISGRTENLAVASVENAQKYWDQVGCAIFGKINMWWYTLQDSSPTTSSPSFGIVEKRLSTTPLFNLSCPSYVSKAAFSDESTASIAPGATSSATAGAPAAHSSVGVSAAAAVSKAMIRCGAGAAVIAILLYV